MIEHHGLKADVLAELGELSKHAGADTILATTTSSLSVAELAQASGHPERFVGFHPFNPVPRMKLVELAFPAEATAETRKRARELATAMGKTPVEVPDSPGLRGQQAAVPVSVRRRRADGAGRACAPRTWTAA